MPASQSPRLTHSINLAALPPAERAQRALESEWIVTNGIGGYASGTLSGINSRRFHGWLIAALPAPHGRTMMLNRLEESLTVSGARTTLVAEDLLEATQQTPASPTLVEFRLEDGLPVWRYSCDSFELEKRLCMIYRQNTTFVQYILLRGPNPRTDACLELNPWIDIRPHEGSLAGPAIARYRLTATFKGYEVSCGRDIPPLLLAHAGRSAAFHMSQGELGNLEYCEEKDRGYDWKGSLWTPGTFSATLSEGESVSLCASSESWEHIEALPVTRAFATEGERRRRLLQTAPEGAREGIAGELVLAADQFLIVPASRAADTVRAQALDKEIRTVIAGYHWFTDWGRDTMISLEGLTLATGRHREAEFILRSFAEHIDHGLIPNMFPEGNTSGLYHTADATLWFFHAIERYVEVTGDRDILRSLVPKMVTVADAHLRGTRFGIGVDPSDGLLRQGEAGYQLTWMDAKVGDWVVTPRRGKAVEINALWYNALCLLAGWLGQLGQHEESSRYGKHAEQARAGFAQKFWYAEGQYLYDVIEAVIEAEPGTTSVVNGNDHTCRPNQVLAIALKHPILDRARWQPVMEKVRAELLTPIGLRSQAPGSPDYKERYFGDLKARDAAYHQGTVWAWLIGPFIDGWLKAYPDDLKTASSFLANFDEHLNRAGIGTISEVFDAEAPFTPRGCIAQAWSVAEVLRLTLLLQSKASLDC